MSEGSFGWLGCCSILFFIPLALYAAGGSLYAVGLVLYHYAGCLGRTFGKSPRYPEGSEPALKHYLYSAAWQDLASAIQSMNAVAAARRARAFEAGRGLVVGGCTAIFGAAWFVAVVTSIVVGYTIFYVLIALHSTVVAVCLVVVALVVGLLHATERVSMMVRRIYFVCPGRDCHRRIALPAYRCPSCAAQHNALIPGSYGAFRRKCQCGNRLPTLLLLGRGRIPAFCPHASCGRALNEVIGSVRNVHLSVVGGPYVGKTAFLTAAMLEIRRRGAVEMQFPESADEVAFRAAESRFERGIPVDKTAGASPNAMLLRIDDAGDRKVLLYIYDAAGELYAGGGDLQRQNFFAHTDGVALLVDPFSLQSVRVDRGREIAVLEPQIRASAELPQNVYDRLVMTLREQRGENVVDVPLAIVITKIDAAGIDREIESTGAREWLVRHGERNLVQSAAHDFRNVRFFACSALGRVPSADTGNAFVSRGVLEPFRWLAEANGVRLQ